ncbi:CoA-disulfide reductase [Evansella halocellulosilytica]|uniref:CoA-disulfide reductase n=1 Tax=Evansella halocellulosilytica TaxID=2011013 RepID=UPI000BB81F2E|nr:CoA-disulfide reductase [Evansella halocellulosilytica]
MKVVIIGGDAAGMSAAMQIVRNDEEAEITVLERGSYYSYAQCGLPYYIGGLVGESEKLIARSRETFRDKHGIDARIYHEVQKLDAEKKTVAGVNLKTSEAFELPFDKCLIATGASPIFPSFDGADLEGIHVLKTIPDADQIIEDMSKDVLEVTVIGGGYIGLEVAENFVRKGKKVRIIDLADRLGTVYDREISKVIEQAAKDHHIELCLGESVEKFSGDTRVEEVHTNKGSYRTNMVIVAIGVKPNTDFAKDTRLHLHQSGAISVNSFMETNIQDIYAAGDCATQYHRIKEKDDFMPLGTHANKQGRVAGSNLAGVTKSFQGIVGTSIMKFFDLTVGKTGLSEQEANEQNIPYDSITFEGHTHAGYYPGSEKIVIKMLRHKTTDQLLGVQAIGKDDVDKRIDVAATALYHKMTISDLENLDISYAPPYNGVWDPLQQAARRM